MGHWFSLAAHPRSRGENPRLGWWACSWHGSSPLTRGKRPHGHDLQPRRRLIPAHAGKTRVWRVDRRVPGAHPRSRGENCGGGLFAFVCEGSSPLTRGKHAMREHDVRRQRLIPAHAGKTCPKTRPCAKCEAHPRSRGENFRRKPFFPADDGSSPLTRGKHVAFVVHELADRLIPAHAGKTCRCLCYVSAWRAHPRSRGENSAVGSNACVAGGSSPLTRGKPSRGLSTGHARRLIPAHAGKTVIYCLPSSAVAAHPRSRGENRVGHEAQFRTAGSSPLTRGKHGVVPQQAALAGLIPAHAGKTWAEAWLGVAPAAHPRSRGENVPVLWRVVGGNGSSPLTRGKHTVDHAERLYERLIPAHAGKTTGWAGAHGCAGAHPRSRGENASGTCGWGCSRGSSPLTRGKLLLDANAAYQERLIPAHAGKTNSNSSRNLSSPAHPRSRGENSVRDHVMDIWGGSSPLTRGKPRHGPDGVSDDRLIPAHAGKTQRPGRTRWRRPAHPRSRGENLPFGAKMNGNSGSSPLTRGKLDLEAAPHAPARLIPAHAGKTSQPQQPRQPPRAHPRSRGENLAFTRRLSPNSGSSPLTRGKPAKSRSQLHVMRLIPAHAGKTLVARLVRRWLLAHPRSRGENVSACGLDFGCGGSSPLTRGKPTIPQHRLCESRLIPAHAGKTLDSDARMLLLRAHPRSRGENMSPPNDMFPSPGSSPLTRGKPSRCCHRLLRGRLIPAHAGKTRR